MQVNSFAEQIGSMEKLVEFYKKNSEQELRTEMFEVKKNVALARKMYEAIIDPIEITPDEVSTYYKTVLQNDLPRFGTELGVAQIVVIPKVGDEQKQKVIDRLKEFKADIIENGASFRTKAVLYSEDIPSRRNGGKYTLNKNRPQMVKEFREVAFSLQEGEISDPFETDFGTPRPAFSGHLHLQRLHLETACAVHESGLLPGYHQRLLQRRWRRPGMTDS